MPMYVASRGITGRVVGTSQKRTEHETNKQRVSLQHRLYVPCMCSTCGGCLLGMLIFSGGAALVVLGFLAQFISDPELPLDDTSHLTTQMTNNFTHAVIEKDVNMKMHLKNLAYFGAMVMAVGGFVLIFVCVIVFETRDKVFELMARKKITTLKKNPNFYELIIESLKLQEEDHYTG